MEVEIRLARHRDRDDIVRLWSELMELHAEMDPRFAVRDDASETFADFALDLIDGDDSGILCALVGDRMVGFLSMGMQAAPPVLRLERFGMIYDAVVTAGKAASTGVNGERSLEIRQECSESWKDRQ